MISPQLLEDRGVFVFDPAAQEEIARWFDSLEPAPGTELVQELVCLTAAEYASIRFVSYPRPVLPVQKPIQVTHGEALLGLLKTDCNPIVCISDHAEGRPLTLNDVTAFSSDAAKLASLGFSIEEPPTEIGEIARAVDTLEHMHRASPPARAVTFGESGLLRLQGFLWAIKLSLPAGNLEEAMAEAYEAFELSTPVGGARAPVPA